MSRTVDWYWMTTSIEIAAIRIIPHSTVNFATSERIILETACRIGAMQDPSGKTG